MAAFLASIAVKRRSNLVSRSGFLIAASRLSVTDLAFPVSFSACDRRAIEFCAVIGHSVPSRKNPANACGSKKSVVVVIVGLELYLFHIVFWFVVCLLALLALNAAPA